MDDDLPSNLRTRLFGGLTEFVAGFDDGVKALLADCFRGSSRRHPRHMAKPRVASASRDRVVIRGLLVSEFISIQMSGLEESVFPSTLDLRKKANIIMSDLAVLEALQEIVRGLRLHRGFHRC